MKLGTSIIKIHCNKLDWNNIISKFDSILLQKIQLSAEEHFRSKSDILKNVFNFNINTNFIKEYEKINDEDKLKYNLPNRSVYYQYIQFMFIIFLLNIFNKNIIIIFKNIYKLNINILVDLIYAYTII